MSSVPSSRPRPAVRTRLAIFAVAAAAAGAVLAGSALVAAFTAPPAAASPAQGFAWEYRVITGRRTLQNRDTRALRDGALNEFTQWNLILNEIGAEGWELVSVIGNPGDSQKEYTFKRPR